MPRRSSPPARRTARPPGRQRASARKPAPSAWAVGIGIVAVALGAGVAGWLAWSRPARVVARAEAAARAGRHAEALAAWRGVNATARAGSSTLLAEARAALALGRAAEADHALTRASAADPGDPMPWRLRLERLRVEDLTLEAQEVGWDAYAAVPPTARRDLLRALTLALLADLPEDVARSTLARWAGADPSRPDPDARAALLRRVAAMPRPDDPDRASRIVELSALVRADPGRLAAREALITALADAGEPELGREALDAWPGPEPDRDARYWRLRGRWDLDYNRRPGPAVAALRRALADLPHDWKTRVRLARALHALGREPESRREAETVNRTREALDPSTLGPRLASDLSRLDSPPALLDLSALCARSGLTRLSAAWRREAAAAR